MGALRPPLSAKGLHNTARDPMFFAAVQTGLLAGDPSMNDQERQIISDIFKRLEQAAGAPRDAEAERFIADKVRAQPYAPYAMAQALYVQEEAMKSLNQQLEQLRAENEDLRQRASSGSGGGLLSSIFGGDSRPQPQGGSFSRPGGGYAPQQPAGPWGGAPQPGPQGPWGGQPGYAQQGGYAAQGGFAQQAPAGGGFLRGALTTAAGVAGGMVVGNALMNAFSGGHHQTLGSLTSADMSNLGFDPSTMAAGGDGGGFFGGSDAGVQNAAFDDGGGASFQDASFDDGGSDFDVGGGGDDSSWS